MSEHFETDDAIFDTAVEYDISKKATEKQFGMLKEDCERWRNLLLKKLHQMDQQFTERKALSIAAGSFDVRRQYETWKVAAVARKKAIVERLVEAKACLRETNRELNGGRDDFLQIIAHEIKMIRELLEDFAEGQT